MSQAPDTAAQARLLVVEDDDTIRETVAEALEMEGFAVTAATNGRSAWDLLSREAFDLHVAALEWSLESPILIEDEKDLESRPSWQGRVEPFAHQVQNLVTFCRRAPVALIADDVGLGKGCTAGLIASELLARRKVSRVLVICPKLLMPQWREELATKFGIEALAVTRITLIQFAATIAIVLIFWLGTRRMRVVPGRFQSLVEMGLDALNPLEVKAGMDPLLLKQTYGRQLVLHGGVNAVLWDQPDRKSTRLNSSHRT